MVIQWLRFWAFIAVVWVQYLVSAAKKKKKENAGIAF